MEDGRIRERVSDVPWRSIDGLVVFALAWLGLPILLLLGMRQLAPYVPFFHNMLISFRNGDISASFFFAVTDAVLGLGLVGYYLRRYKVDWRAVGWRRTNVLKTVAYVLGAVILFAILVQLAFFVVQILFPHFNADQAQVNEFTKAASPANKRLALIALVILPPIVEETVFRGFIFPAFSKRLGLVVGALASSALFGLAHLQYNVSVYTIVLGLILCFMYVRLRSIFPGMILHMVNNYLAYVALFHK